MDAQFHIFEIRRPVPLEEVFVEAILKILFTDEKFTEMAKLIEGALRLGLGPILVLHRDEERRKKLPSNLPTNYLRLTLWN